MTTPKRHHYLSQFYLAGFTSDSKKDGDLYCFDLKKRKVRKSKVNLEGHEKGFNKLDAESIDKNYLERELAKFETEVATLFKEIIKNKTLPSTQKDWGTLFYYIALLGVRNPAVRETMDDARTNIMKMSLQYYLTDSATWEKYKSQFKEEELKEIKKLSLVEARKKLLSSDWKIITVPSEHTRIEIPIVKKVTDLLSHRQWSLIDATKSTSDFITSDRPVKLFWHLKDVRPPNFGPGFGSKNSMLFLPISKKLYLLGNFENQSPPHAIANEEMVASTNSMQIFYSRRYLYGSQSFFYFDDKYKNNVSSSKYFK